MVIGGLGGAFAVKRRPKSYRARDAAYRVGGNRGFYIASLPRKYPLNAPQRRVRDAAIRCGIRKGISKAELMDKMVNCIKTGGRGGSTGGAF